MRQLQSNQGEQEYRIIEQLPKTLSLEAAMLPDETIYNQDALMERFEEKKRKNKHGENFYSETNVSPEYGERW